MRTLPPHPGPRTLARGSCLSAPAGCWALRLSCFPVKPGCVSNAPKPDPITPGFKPRERRGASERAAPRSSLPGCRPHVFIRTSPTRGAGVQGSRFKVLPRLSTPPPPTAGAAAGLWLSPTGTDSPAQDDALAGRIRFDLYCCMVDSRAGGCLDPYRGQRSWPSPCLGNSVQGAVYSCHLPQVTANSCVGPCCPKRLTDSKSSAILRHDQSTRRNR